jgi:hypothetical protein
MSTLHVYDKAKYHYETVANYGLPEDSAYYHTAYFLKWLIEKDLVGGVFLDDFSEELSQCKNNKMSVIKLYKIVDRCLVSDMLSEEGNRFTLYYFDFENGSYLADYAEALASDLESIFHVSYNDEIYNQIKQVIEKRYNDWKRGV